MTWPTGNISTANLDAGADRPSLARVQLKDTVDAVNTIIAEFGNVNIAGAANNSVITRSGNTWIAAASSTGTASGTAYVKPLETSYQVTSTFSNRSGRYQVVDAGGTGITTNGTDSNITVPAGTYIWECNGLAVAEFSTQDDPMIRLWNRTANAEIATVQGLQTGSKSGPIYFSAISGSIAKFTLTGTANIEPRYGASGNGNGSLDVSILNYRFIKVS